MYKNSKAVWKGFDQLDTALDKLCDELDNFNLENDETTEEFDRALDNAFDARKLLQVLESLLRAGIGEEA